VIDIAMHGLAPYVMAHGMRKRWEGWSKKSMGASKKLIVGGD
jgi:hypothetical protein